MNVDRTHLGFLAGWLCLLLAIGCDDDSSDTPAESDAGDTGEVAEADAVDDEGAVDTEPDASGDDTTTHDAESDATDTAVVWTECGAPPTGLVSFLGAEFDSLLGILWEDYWSDDGDWIGDMMGDATAFAPELLFPMAHHAGCTDLRDRAITTVEHEEQLAYGYLNSGANEMETIVGAPALITGTEWTGDTTYQFLALSGLTVLTDQILSNPEALILFYRPPVALGSTAYYILYYTEVSGDETLLERALEAIELADERYWDEEAGYYDALWDWSQAMMLMALAYAYDFTGETAYLERAERLASTVLDLMWDDDRGGFWATHKDDEVGKGLSGQAFMTRAFLMMYAATCDDSYRSVAADTLAYSFSTDLYVDGLIRHDWTPGDGTSPDVCTGCNWFTLSNLWIYERLVDGCE